MDLIAWLTAQLDEDEQAARRLPEGHRLYVDDDGCVEQSLEQWSDGSDRLPNHHNTWLLMYDQTERLADIAAKRRLLDWLVDCQAKALDGNWWNLDVDDALMVLAQPYAGRDGWRDEWKIAD